MALTQISTQGIKDGTITGSDLATNVDLVDNQKIRLGTGNDLEIFHDGGGSIIKDVGTGDLRIGGDGDLLVMNAALSEIKAKFSSDGAVELYYDNSKKLETTSGGVDVTGQLTVALNSTSRIEMFHFGNTNFIRPQGGSLDIITPNNTNIARFIPGGAVELYHNNSKKFETTSYGAKVTGRLAATTSFTGSDNVKLILGDSDDLQIYHDGTDSFIDFSNALKISDDGVVKAVWTNTYYGLLDNIKLNLGTGLDTEIYHDGTDTFINQKTNALKFDYNGTTKYYFTTSFLTFQDNFKAAFGTSQDLQIFHDGNNSKISHVGAGGLYIGADTFGLQTGDHSENYITMAANGAVELYYDNSKKLETTSGGVDVTGALTVNGAAIGGGGKVIQVLRTTASMSSTSSASFQSTGLSQAITMTNSANKVLAIATGGFNNASAGAGGGASIFRGTANLAHSNDLMASYFGEDDSNNIEYTATFTSLDTPGAGTHTYTVQLRAFSGTMRFAYRNTGVLTLIELDYS